MSNEMDAVNYDFIKLLIRYLRIGRISEAMLLVSDLSKLIRRIKGSSCDVNVDRQLASITSGVVESLKKKDYCLCADYIEYDFMEFMKSILNKL